MDLTHRIDRPELMDTQVYPVAVMRRTLAFLELTNRYFGGANVIVNQFKEWSKRWIPSQNIRVLDVGTGSAEIPIALVRWARSAGFKVEVVAIDLVEEVVQVAREKTGGYPEISVRCQNIFELEATQSFDYVTASLLLHHIPPADGSRILQAFDRLAKRGMIISDLLRTKPSFVAVTCLSWLAGNAIVRHDGPLSVRRAFLPEELNALAQEARLSYLRARQEPWFRVSLAGEKE